MYSPLLAFKCINETNLTPYIPSVAVCATKEWSMKLLSYIKRLIRIKDWLMLCCSCWTTAPIHWGDPTTERHEGFDLLLCWPGLMHPSLDDLVALDSPRNTTSIPKLVRTPNLHSRCSSELPSSSGPPASASR